MSAGVNDTFSVAGAVLLLFRFLPAAHARRATASATALRIVVGVEGLAADGARRRGGAVAPVARRLSRWAARRATTMASFEEDAYDLGEAERE